MCKKRHLSRKRRTAKKQVGRWRMHYKKYHRTQYKELCKKKNWLYCDVWKVVTSRALTDKDWSELEEDYDKF